MEEIFNGLGFAPFGVITAICFIVGICINHAAKDTVKKSIPEIMILVGAGLGIAMFFTSVEFRAIAGEFWWALAIGGISGVAATGIHQVWKQKQSGKNVDILTSVSDIMGGRPNETGIADVQDVDNSANANDIGITQSDLSADGVDPSKPTEFVPEEGFNSSVTPSDIDPTTPSAQ